MTYAKEFYRGSAGELSKGENKQRFLKGWRNSQRPAVVSNTAGINRIDESAFVCERG
ncbi:hypothetical protein [Bradyrhizobium sp. CCGB01]|uniref:hypothetical protein n=1 Tax=Bradyrhizobium sp. CCGB01 TaxID=2949634 RepID=UPI0020B29520|nr:hypothetical protein [Bradyrhizobium sp. CCGB01]MCP3411350.1 hypothetical protein [Bradyrhizobium sp. CCGB01]